MHMYAQHFKLHLLPFENVPDPLFFYDQGDHARIRKQISGSLQSGRGLIVVTGPIGSGKTTLSQMIKADFPQNIQVIWMAEPPASSSDLYLFLAQELGVQPSSAEKTFVMRDIRNALMQINSAGKKCLVIIDESHLMTDDVINGVRLLNNLEEGSTKLIQLLLLGQEELMEKINKPEMLPFKQRIATLETLGRMNVDGVLKYISHRIHVAGGDTSLMSETGWEALSIAFRGGGTPRTMNTLCDRAFNVAYERNKSAIDAEDIYEATQRMGLVTDVFHYIIMLKNQQRKKEEAQIVKPQDKASAEVNKASVKEPAQVTEITKIQRKQQQETDVPDPDGEDFDAAVKSYETIANTIKKRYEQKSLKIPAILLLISTLALMSSIFFYCHRTDSEGLISCLKSLI
ncbi:MAG: AAA family ATPase [Nitrosomonas sp.]|nr:MAG: AAA family ATPase [Nitrosomonas sp.]